MEPVRGQEKEKEKILKKVEKRKTETERNGIENRKMVLRKLMRLSGVRRTRVVLQQHSSPDVEIKAWRRKICPRVVVQKSRILEEGRL